MRLRRVVLVGIMLCLALALSCPPVFGKGKDSNGGGSSVKIEIKVSTQFANFPLPFAAQVVGKDKQKAAKEWTEYRVVGFSAATLTTFYKNNMPGHGWKLKSNKGNTWTWGRGNRTVVVVFVQVTPLLSFIQVREYK
ncbi:MAG: hypothetical protein ACM3ZC_17005 [Bacteroidota bacterium]